MKKIELRGVKRVNLRSVFNTVSRRGSASRADASAETGLSLMTVGKIVDAFKEAGIFTEEKEEYRQLAGRRAGLISLRRDAYAAVIDLSERAFRLHIIDFTLRYYEGTTFTYDRDFYYDENLNVFLKRVRSYLSSRPHLSELYGIAIAVPGVYDAAADLVTDAKIPELSSINIKAEAERLLGRKVDIVIKSAEAAALSYAEDKGGDKVIVGLLIGDAVDGAIYSHGSFIEGTHGGGADIGGMIISGTQRVGERLSFSSTDVSTADEAALAIYNIISMIDPDAFVIECPRLREPDYFISRIERALTDIYSLPTERMPEFYVGNGNRRHVSRGAAAVLRGNWIENNI